MKFNLSRGGIEVEIDDFESIEDIILELEEYSDEAIILEAEPPINKCNFIQAYYPRQEYDDGLGYEVETSILNDEGFRLYRYRTIDVRNVITIFKEYFEEGKIPNVQLWEDMTDELK